MSEETVSERGASSAAGLSESAALTIPAFWREAVDAHADRVMIRMDGKSLTYRDVDRRSAALARGLLAEGAAKASRIGLLMPNGPEWIIAWLAVNRIGALAVCLSTFFPAPELRYAIRHADIQILLTADRYLRHDYAARLEEAFPALLDSAGSSPLALAEAPFLRSVWFTGEAEHGWSRGSFARLEALGAASAAFDADFLAAVEEVVSPADLAVLIYTSGSTAHPKGVLHSQGVMVRKTRFLARDKGIIPFAAELGDKTVVTSPLFWVGGFLTLTGAIAKGMTMVFIDDHSPRALLELIRREKADQLMGSAALLATLRDSSWHQPGDLDRLRAQNSNQFSFFNRDPTVTSDRFAASLGMTETFGPHSGDITGSLLPPHAAGSVGPALDGMEYKIVDPETGELAPLGQAGELCVRGGWLMQGMYKKEREEVFDADGFYHTGDQCVLRPDGYLFFVSRLSGMIKTSGANVSPEEVEQAVLAFGDVAETAVMGVPDRKAGELVVAAVVRRLDSTLDERTLQARLREQVSSFKVPKRVFFFAFEDLPRTPSNKIRKPALAEMIVGLMAKEDQAAAGGPAAGA
jgi:acyl-coenzyme A synthetase/AMP-(fatty) acid ligase